MAKELWADMHQRKWRERYDDTGDTYGIFKNASDAALGGFSDSVCDFCNDGNCKLCGQYGTSEGGLAGPLGAAHIVRRCIFSACLVRRSVFLRVEMGTSGT